MRPLYSSAGAAVLAFALLCLAPAAGDEVSAQRGGARPSSVERRLEQLNRQSEQYERDKLTRDLKRAGREPRDAGMARAAEARVRQDLEDLQAGYNKIVIAMSSGRGTDSEEISGAVAVVHKCATRLRGDLALPRPEDEEGEGAGVAAGDVRAGNTLLALRRHIYDFVTSPLFDAPAVLDVEQAWKAGRDLDRIIELSEAIRKSGDRKTEPNGP